MGKTPIGVIAEAIGKVASAWQTHLEKKRELYELSLQKKREKNDKKAIDYAEKSFLVASEYFDYVHNSIPLEDNDRNNLNKIKVEYYKLRDKFNKFD